MESILKIENLTKRFSEVVALDNVSLEVERGSILGLLGPNGAGKTTLLRIINGLLTIDSGSIRILDKDVSLATSGHIGYMPEERGLYDNMSIENQILFFGLLKGGSEPRMKEVMAEYLELFNLSGNEKRKVKELSKGNQQKVQIISTLVHEPELVILDEPFSGFDPINGMLLQELIDRLHARGTTIILSSHNMHAVETMCSHIALVNHGHILVDGKLEDVKEANKTNDLIFTCEKELDKDFIKGSGLILEINEDICREGRKGFAYRVVKMPEISNAALVREISAQSDITHFEEALPSLNDIFLLYTTTTDPAVPTTVNENPAPESAETADKSLTREETGVQTTTNNNLQ